MANTIREGKGLGGRSANGRMVKCALWGIGLFAFAAYAQVELAVGTRGLKSVVMPPSGTQAGEWILGPESHLGLSGEGVLALDASKFHAASNAALCVHSGTVRVTDAGTPPVQMAAPEILNQAALWMDAGTNVVFEENGTDVREWHDVREVPGTATMDCRYVRAVADHSFKTESPVFRTIESDKPSLYFGGARSGIAMHFSTAVNADGVSLTNGFTTICHAFYVHGVYQAYGYVLGGARNVPHSFGLVNSNGSPDQNIAGYNATDSTELYHSRVYQNGELVDPQHTRVLKDQLSLHEYEFLHNGRASAFYNERFLNGTIDRTGGDNLCEVVIFTNRLTEADRLAVGAYLSDKWLGRTARPLPLVLASEAAVQFDAEQMPFGVSGTGALSLESGSFSLTNRTAQAFHGSVSIGPEATVQAGPALPVKAVSGTTVQIDDNVATVAAGPEKTITKSGNGALTLASVPEDAERLVVSAGSLTLTGARRGSGIVSGAIQEPLLADASFEELTTAAFQRMQSADVSYANGVRVFVSDRGAENAEGSYGGPYRTLSNESSVGGSYPAPHGSYAMFLSRMACCSIPVTFYAEGVYRLAFSARARSTIRQGQRHNIKIVQDGVTNLVGRITTWGDEFFRYAFLTPRLAAGPATLLLEGVGERENGVLLNAGSLFDDIQLAYYGQTPEKAVAVPNGDFEADYHCPISSTAVRAMPGFNVANTIGGWTFTQGPTYDEHPTWGPQVGIAQPFMGSGGVKNCQFFNLGENRFGMSQLTLFGPGASAQTDPFAVPAGRYRVRADIGWFTVTQPNGGASNTSYVDPQKVDVSVKVGEGGWIQIGTLSTVNKLFTPTLVKDEFAVNDGETVSLKFETTVSRGCMLMDNVVLVPQEGVLPLATGTKVLDNSRPALWATRVANTDEGGSNSSVTTRGYSTDPALNYFGVELCPAIPNLNTQFLILTQRGSASTSVTFPVAGRYRLSVWAAQRHDMTGQRNRANCPFEVWLKDAAGNVRTLGRTRVDHDNYLQYVFTFDVADVSSPYALGLQGAQFYSADDPSNNHSVRLDCVDLEYAGDSLSDVELPENLAIDVAEGSTLRLDFLGTNTVGSLRVAGRSYAGYVSAAERPELGSALTGPGTLYILPRGTMLIFR